MMDRSMLQRLRQISISSSLRGAFLMGAADADCQQRQPLFLA
jgi:hypothetical protein